MNDELDDNLERFEFVGGALALDFANTVSNHTPLRPNEELRSFEDLVEWGSAAGLFGPEEAAKMLARGRARPGEAQTVFKRAMSLRETIYRVFSSIAAAHQPAPKDLDLLNRELSRGLVHARVHPSGGQFELGWAHDGALDRLLWPVARSAAELLISRDGKLERVRECGGSTCGWLFVDLSRNRSRTWCDMKGCGNRAKARRHYHRARSATPA